MKNENEKCIIKEGLFFSEDFKKIPNCVIFIKRGFIIKLEDKKKK